MASSCSCLAVLSVTVWHFLCAGSAMTVPGACSIAPSFHHVWNTAFCHCCSRPEQCAQVSKLHTWVLHTNHHCSKPCNCLANQICQSSTHHVSLGDAQASYAGYGFGLVLEALPIVLCPIYSAAGLVACTWKPVRSHCDQTAMTGQVKLYLPFAAIDKWC
jgi:hypothetical protein